MIFALILAVWILGEQLTLFRILGILLVFFAPLLIAGGKKKPPPSNKKPPVSAGAAATDATPAWQPDYVEGFIFAILSSAGYGASFVIVRLGINATTSAGVDANVSILAAVTAYTVATIVLGVYLVLSGELRGILGVEKKSGIAFIAASSMAGIAIMLRFAAISLAPISVVAPLKRLSTIATLFFSTLINRNHEIFNPRVLIATGLSFVGALMLSLSTEFILVNLALPDWVAQAARWQWP
jgi:drug/metabolite transporter (DMT)-like permease